MSDDFYDGKWAYAYATDSGDASVEPSIPSKSELEDTKGLYTSVFFLVGVLLPLVLLTGSVTITAMKLKLSKIADILAILAGILLLFQPYLCLYSQGVREDSAPRDKMPVFWYCTGLKTPTEAIQGRNDAWRDSMICMQWTNLIRLIAHLALIAFATFGLVGLFDSPKDAELEQADDVDADGEGPDADNDEENPHEADNDVGADV